MTEVERIAQELEQAHGGHPWHGPSRASVLADVAFEEAARRPSPEGHSIWALVLHMRAWTGEVARRLRDGDAREPIDGDWPPVPAPGAQAWRETLAALEQAHRDLIAAVRASSPARLDERGGGGDPSLGAHMTYRVMLHGLAQHDAYHTGQISLLKRIHRDGAS
jgi:uncharacterized damage-inducible protein DinB